MKCANAQCPATAKVVIQTQEDQASVELTGTAICAGKTTVHNDNLRHHSAPETRRALEDAAKSGVGPTEAYED